MVARRGDDIVAPRDECGNETASENAGSSGEKICPLVCQLDPVASHLSSVCRLNPRPTATQLIVEDADGVHCGEVRHT
jgi:hypothetical protein